MCTRIFQQQLVLTPAAACSDDEAPRDRQAIQLQLRQGFEEHAVILVPIEIANREYNELSRRAPKLLPHSVCVSNGRRHTVVDDSERTLAQREIVCEFLASRVRDSDHAAG